MRLSTTALAPLMLFALACSDTSSLPVSGGDLSNSPPAPINGSDGDAFAPPAAQPEGAGPSGGGSAPDAGGGTGTPGEEGTPPPAPVPEPGTLLLVGSGLAGLAIAGRRRRRAADAEAAS